MFIFSQFNFPDPKPQVSKGDCKVPGEARVEGGGWGGTGPAVAQEPNAKLGGGSPKGDEGEPKEGFALPQEARINQTTDLRCFLVPSLDFSFLI